MAIINDLLGPTPITSALSLIGGAGNALGVQGDVAQGGLNALQRMTMAPEQQADLYQRQQAAKVSPQDMDFNNPQFVKSALENPYLMKSANDLINLQQNMSINKLMQAGLNDSQSTPAAPTPASQPAPTQSSQPVSGTQFPVGHPLNASTWIGGLVKHESSGDNTKIGDGGLAVGFGQLHPGAAKDAGIQPDDRYNPTLNMQATQTYLQQKLDKYKDPYSALLAYNMGDKAVDDWQASGGDPKDLPPERAAYPGKVTGGKVNAPAPMKGYQAMPLPQTPSAQTLPQEQQAPQGQEVPQAQPSQAQAQPQSAYNNQQVPPALQNILPPDLQQRLKHANLIGMKLPAVGDMMIKGIEADPRYAAAVEGAKTGSAWVQNANKQFIQPGMQNNAPVNSSPPSNTIPAPTAIPAEMPKAQDGKPLIPTIGNIAKYPPNAQKIPDFTQPVSSNPTDTEVDNAKNTTNTLTNSAIKQNEGFSTLQDSLSKEKYYTQNLISIYSDMQSPTAAAQYPEIAQKAYNLGLISDAASIKNLGDIQAALNTSSKLVVQNLKDLSAGLDADHPMRIFGTEVTANLENAVNPALTPAARYNYLTSTLGLVNRNIDAISTWNSPQVGGLGNRLNGGKTMPPNEYMQNFINNHDAQDYKKLVIDQTPPFPGMPGNKGSTPGGVTHVYQPGKGIVPVGSQ